jgi:hypothetical protein
MNSGLRKSFANRKAHQLCARLNAQFLHNALLMPIHGLRTARKFLTDLPARESLSDQSQYFEFALCQEIEQRRRWSGLHGLTRADRPLPRHTHFRRLATRAHFRPHHERSLSTARDALQSLDDLLKVVTLREVATPAASIRRGKESISNVCTQEYEANFGMEMVQAIRNLENIRTGHFDIKNNNVGAMFRNRIDRVFCALEARNTSELSINAELCLEAFDEHDVIVDAKNANRCL